VSDSAPVPCDLVRRIICNRAASGGGSFHCTALDIRRRGDLESYY
jgi:hypothetical protein